MVAVESNIANVIGRVKRLKERDIPVAMARSLEPNRWKELAREEAEATLTALAEQEERHYIPEFVRVVTSQPFLNGVCLRMHSPFGEDASLEDFQSAAAATRPLDLNENLFQAKVEQFRDLILKWVETEKRKDRRDLGKTDEDIAQFISYLMLAPLGALTPHELKARESLMPHIAEFIQRSQLDSRLPAAKTELWLRAVLSAWRELFRSHWPELFRNALRELRA